jgi:DNA replication protein DnaC
MLQELDRYALLVIDDITYMRRNELETSVLFELICHRYERQSLLVTSNQPFREWDDIFPSGSMTVAAVDQLVHHCHIIGIKGESYRQKAAAAWVSRTPDDTPT